MEPMESTVTQTAPGGKRLEKKSHKGRWTALCILAALLAGYLGFSAWASSRDTIFPNLSVRTHAIGGMTQEQAAEALAAVGDLPSNAAISLFLVTFEDRQQGLPESTPQDLTFADLGGVQLDSETCAERAWEYCHGGSFFTAGWRYLLCAAGKANITAALTAPHLEEHAAALAERLSLPAVDTAYALKENAIALTIPRAGYTIEPADLQEAIQTALQEDLIVADCPGTPVAAKQLTAQEILDQVSGEMKNAGYDPVSKSILPEQVGADFDAAAAQSLMDAAQPGETISVPADIQFPDVTAEELKQVLFRDLLGECTTQVRGSSARRNNVRLSSSAFNGYVLNDGEVFSYNGVVGKRTTAKGYQAAPAYVKGETVDEIGGGVCQPSSTLYLACLRADLEITERYAHRYVPSYIPAGMDATVSWGGPDYKFTNNTGYPLRITTSYSNSRLTVQIWGTNADGITVKMTNEHISTTPFEEVIEEDPSLAPGEKKVKVTPYTGHKYQTYRNRYDKNGKLISSTYEATSNYKARNRVILQGPPAAPTAPVAPVVPTPLPETPVAPPTPPEDNSSDSGFIIQDPESIPPDGI